MNKTATFTFHDGRQVEYDYIPFPQLDFEGELPGEALIKVNLPENEAGYQRGNGEGMWALVTPATKEKYNADYTSAPGELFFARLMNQSVYFMGMLKWGMVVPMEMRGNKRPVVPWSEIRHKDWSDEQGALEANLAAIEAKKNTVTQ